MKVTLMLLAALTTVAVRATLYNVDIPENAKPYERKAAEELRHYLDLRVKDGFTVDGESGPVFHVGETAFAKSHEAIGKLVDEEWIVRSFGRDILIVGGGTRGTLYAVYHFLEDELGVRWWSQIEEDVPPASALALGHLDRKGRPAFRKRDIYMAPVRERDFDAFVTRCRLNGCGRRSAEFGYAFSYGSPKDCHTFNLYLGEAEFKEHPEYFAYRRDKKARLSGMYSQICLSSPDVRTFVAGRLREFIAADRKRCDEQGCPYPFVYDVSQNDNDAYCECDECEALKHKWGMSGLVIDFVNSIAASVREDYPEIILSTMAYRKTEVPPLGGMKAADNVMVDLCNTRSNQAAGKFEPGNTIMTDGIAAWSKIAKRISISDYSINYNPPLTGLPFASEFHYADYFRFAHKHGTFGLFLEHESQHKSDFFELKFFLESKLLENPYQDGDALISRFMREYYGPAGDVVGEYRRSLECARKAHAGVVKWFPSLDEWNWLDDETMASSQKLFDRAMQSVGGVEPFRSRVCRARLGLDRLLVLRTKMAGAMKSPEAKTAAKRVRSFWPKWISRYKSLKDDTARNELEALLGLPPPKRFAKCEICDFPASAINLGDSRCKDARLVDDPQSEIGRAVCIDGDASSHYDLPYRPGVYSKTTDEILLAGRFERPLSEKGYAWYELGTATVPGSFDEKSESILWLSGTWQQKLDLGMWAYLRGHAFRFWVSAKFTGRKYQRGSTAPSRIWIDRVVLERVDGLP